MAEVKYQVAMGNGIHLFEGKNALQQLIQHVGFPVTRRDVLSMKHRGITVFEADKEGNIVPDSFGGLPWADPKYRDEYIALGVEIPGITDVEVPEAQQEAPTTPETTDETVAPDEVETPDTQEDADEPDSPEEPDSTDDSEDEDDNEPLLCTFCGNAVDEDSYATTATGEPVCDPCIEKAKKLMQAQMKGGRPNTNTTTPPVRSHAPQRNTTGIPVAVAQVNKNPVFSEPEYPEVGSFKDEKAMKKFIKKLTDDQLQEWCELEGVTWSANDNQSINRMRMAMGIKAKHGFGQVQGSGGTKSRSKYADYQTEDLVAMCLDHDLDLRDAKGDMRILRMYAIMALRDAGVLE